MTKNKENSYDLEFLSKKITVLEERVQFLKKVQSDLTESGKKLSEKQVDLIKQMVPYTTTKQDVVKDNPNLELSQTAWTNVSGKLVRPTKEDVIVILPEIVDPSTFKFLKSVLRFANLSEKQEKVLVRIWDEIVNQGMYTA